MRVAVCSALCQATAKKLYCLRRYTYSTPLIALRTLLLWNSSCP